MVLESRLSYIRKNCKLNTVNEILDIYKKNNLNYTFKKIYIDKFDKFLNTLSKAG